MNFKKEGRVARFGFLMLSRRRFLNQLGRAGSGLAGGLALASLAGRASASGLASQSVVSNSPFDVHLVDVGAQAGLNAVCVSGPPDTKRWIVETTGCGIAFFDYDNDGWLDIFQVNGTTLALSGIPSAAGIRNLKSEIQNSPAAEIRNVKSEIQDSPASEIRNVKSEIRDSRASEIRNVKSEIHDFSLAEIRNVKSEIQKLPTCHLYRNNRNGTFADVTERAGLAHTGWGQGVCVGDYDNDGWDDLFLTCWGENALYHNNGDGTFTDVTEKAGLLQHGSRPRWNTGCCFVDYDRDGHLDLFVANYVDLDLAATPAMGSGPYCHWKGVPVMCGPRGLPGATNILYHNNGAGTFTEVTEKAGILKTHGHYAFTALTGDFDNDGWPDIYVACDSTQSILYHNNHDGTFTDIALPAGCAVNEDGQVQAGMGATAGDYNCDGWLDIFKTNFSDDTSTLYRNNGDGTFTDSTFAAGLGLNTKWLGWGCGFVDLDNDGWADIFLANGHVYPELERTGLDYYKEPKVVYRNLHDGRFEDVSKLAGPGVALLRSARGVAFGDFDNDGHVDVVVNNMNAAPTLLRNDGANQHHWLKVKALGTRSNRSGIGARVRVVTGDHSQIGEVRSGGSYISQNDLRLHFGLGSAATVDLLEVRWPSGAVDSVKNVAANQVVLVEEGKGAVKSTRPGPTSVAVSGADPDALPSQTRRSLHFGPLS